MQKVIFRTLHAKSLRCRKEPDRSSKGVGDAKTSQIEAAKVLETQNRARSELKLSWTRKKTGRSEQKTRRALLHGRTLSQVNPAVPQAYCYAAARLDDEAAPPPCSDRWRPLQHRHDVESHETRQVRAAADDAHCPRHYRPVNTAAQLSYHVHIPNRIITVSKHTNRSAHARLAITNPDYTGNPAEWMRQIQYPTACLRVA